jgi:hypothetical protein
VKPNLQTRKPVTDLTPDDFAVYAVWEYAIDEEEIPGRDETWVKPTLRTSLTRGLYSQLVLARFVTARGEALPGFVDVSTAKREPDVQPGALLIPSYLPLPMLSRAQAVARRQHWEIECRRKILRALHRREGSVFPMSYQVQVPLGKRGGLFEGRVR